MRSVIAATTACVLLFIAVPLVAQDQTKPAASSAQSSTPVPATQSVPTLVGSKITGLSLVDKKGERIGSIKDILVTGEHVQQYIIAIGGTVAGIGEKNHAIEPDKISFENDVKGNLQAKIVLGKDEVQQLPEYKY
ncbi:MAG TPA: PRC-barrel domain-containing protein [Candidatus Dormibacteraeota bacterium]|nr:PRC-barrel domain-containing protein [Candidatus Dormibacteraeota bacterium]